MSSATSNDCSGPSQAYTSTGVYTVTLTVSGSGGSDTETKPECINVSTSIYLPLIVRD